MEHPTLTIVWLWVFVMTKQHHCDPVTHIHVVWNWKCNSKFEQFSIAFVTFFPSLLEKHASLSLLVKKKKKKYINYLHSCRSFLSYSNICFKTKKSISLFSSVNWAVQLWRLLFIVTNRDYSRYLNIQKTLLCILLGQRDESQQSIDCCDFHTCFCDLYKWWKY